MNAVFEETTKNLKEQEIIHTTAVKTATKQLANFKKSSLTDAQLKEYQMDIESTHDQDDVSTDGWKIEYEQD